MSTEDILLKEIKKLRAQLESANFPINMLTMDVSSLKGELGVDSIFSGRPLSTHSRRFTTVVWGGCRDWSAIDLEGFLIVSSFRDFWVDVCGYVNSQSLFYLALTRTMYQMVHNHFGRYIHITEKALHALCGLGTLVIVVDSPEGKKVGCPRLV